MRVTAFSAYEKRNKGNKKKSTFKSNKENLDMSKVRCFNYQRHAHFVRDCKERIRAPRLKNKSDCRKDTFENQRKCHLKKSKV